ncbi:MAG: FAD-binding oxidoreductase [Cyclobacteriaceae bacterium]|nr:FAD-binding oxidoreductase [Cyclobacteriaceae bacterium]
MVRAISNWGNYPVIQANEFSISSQEDIRQRLLDSSLIVRGNGRCYGDASLAPSIVSSVGLNRFLAWNPMDGILTCQSGVLLSEILEVFVPKGWFLPVTPGTKYITVGGAVASDVHGKNHHVDGSFSQHVIELELMTGQGELITCSRDTHPDIFWATCGGMGLTGAILAVTFRLKKIATSFIRYHHIKARNLYEILDLFDQYSSATYSVAWIDCLIKGENFGRSILMLGETASPEDLTENNERLRAGKEPFLNVPFNFPAFALNKLSIRAFNALYYGKNLTKESRKIVHYEPFFYPLDSILNWNRIYGSRGFVQYQFVLPEDSGRKGIEDILQRISKRGLGSFLAVLKQFGYQNDLISFPMKGYTLALDIPIVYGLFEFLNQLDEVVAGYGGRIYLSKDARMSSEIFWKTYKNAPKFQEVILRYDPELKFCSELSKRLKIKG